MLTLDYIFLEIILTLTLMSLNRSTSTIMTWYFTGLFLIITSGLIFKYDGDILAGFLMVLELGLGLMFFLFVIYLSNFLQYKTMFTLNLKLNLTTIFYVLTLFILILLQNTTVKNINIELLWPMLVTHYDYYLVFNLYIKSDLYILKEIYYNYLGHEFFLINYVILYAVFTTLVMFFNLKTILILMNNVSLTDLRVLKSTNFITFIRIQNFTKQLNTTAGVRVWSKNINFKTQ